MFADAHVHTLGPNPVSDDSGGDFMSFSWPCFRLGRAAHDARRRAGNNKTHVEAMGGCSRRNLRHAAMPSAHDQPCIKRGLAGRP